MQVKVVFAFQTTEVSIVELRWSKCGQRQWLGETYLTEYKDRRASFLDLDRELSVQITCDPSDGYTSPMLNNRPILVEETCAV
jgi:hypothetical protein